MPVGKAAGKLVLASPRDGYLEPLRNASKTVLGKKVMAKMIKDGCSAPGRVNRLLGKTRPAKVAEWLGRPERGPCQGKAQLGDIRAVFRQASENWRRYENPAAKIDARKSERPIRTTSSRKPFRPVVKSVRRLSLQPISECIPSVRPNLKGIEWTSLSR
jgi:hypothetical protein